MSHEVETMMYVGETPWHGLGVQLIGAPSIPEALDAAGLNWEVGLAELATTGFAAAQPGDNGEARPRVLNVLPVAHRAVYRKSDGSILGVVGPQFTPLQNKDALAWFAPFLDAGVAQLETAGSLRGGSRVWALARVTNPETGSQVIEALDQAQRDRVASYILLSHGHDGTLAVRAGFTPIRVVCANTLAMAHFDGGSQLIRLRHTQGVKDALAQVSAIMETGATRFRATLEQYRALAAAGCNVDDLERYVLRIFEPTGATKEAKRAAEQRLLDKVLPLASHGRGAELARGTWWGAYNAVTEYVQHERRAQSREARLDSTWFGAGAKTSLDAYGLAVELSGVAA